MHFFLLLGPARSSIGRYSARPGTRKSSVRPNTIGGSSDAFRILNEKIPAALNFFFLSNLLFFSFLKEETQNFSKVHCFDREKLSVAVNVFYGGIFPARI